MAAHKKSWVISGIFALVISGIAATKPAEAGDRPTNLKVLPKNISDDELERIMYTFEKQLGVTCDYCHAYTKNITPKRVDFASDEKPAKNIARLMMKMTIKLNKKYFHVANSATVLTHPVIWCKTCHRGFPVPQYPK